MANSDMITKPQAAAIQTAAIAAAVLALPGRLNDAIILAATNGLASVTFAYAPATSAQVDAFIASTMTAALWTCVNNNIATPGNFTITVS